MEVLFASYWFDFLATVFDFVEAVIGLPLLVGLGLKTGL